ncbi:MAG: hypothetical protein WCF79_06940, partial [Rhodomicrobium sp.]
VNTSQPGSQAHTLLCPSWGNQRLTPLMWMNMGTGDGGRADCRSGLTALVMAAFETAMPLNPN